MTFKDPSAAVAETTGFICRKSAGNAPGDRKGPAILYVQRETEHIEEER